MTNPIRVCLVGAGRAGQVHAESLVQHVPQGQLVALVDQNAPALEKAGERFGIEARFSSVEEAAAHIAFDAVVITTPTFTHREIAKAAAALGKHILCEKPMALSLEECDEMIAAADQNGVILQIGFMRRFDPDFEAAAARIEAGEIGRPMVIKSLTHGPGLPPAWARDLPTSNGMLAEVNSHDWDTVRWLAYSNPERVYTEVSNFKGEKHGVDTPHFYDTALVNVRFESGTLASISGICPCDYGYDARVEIVGEKGLLQIGDFRGQAIVVCTNRDHGLVTPIYRTWPERFGSAYVREMKHFLECVRSGSKPRVSGQDGRWAVASVLAATTSFLEERSVRLSEVLEKHSQDVKVEVAR
jgi:myo-inositol 2-dehydrogenase/D-chiro-inositol 1-dehydrogenase/scyllo-inositol 2-dehydrogenase (NAD+)